MATRWPTKSANRRGLMAQLEVAVVGALVGVADAVDGRRHVAPLSRVSAYLTRSSSGAPSGAPRSAFSGLAQAEAEVLERRPRREEGVGRGRRRPASPAGDRRQLADLVAELHHEPLGELLADAGDALELLHVVASHGQLELLHRIAREHRESHLGPHAADADEPLEEHALPDAAKAEQLERVLAHVQVRVQADFVAEPARQTAERAPRGQDLDAEAAHLDHGVLAVDQLQLAADRGDHAPAARGAAHRRGERGAVVVRVGDGDGQRVGGVVGLRDARQAEDHLGHLLHLDLARASVPGDRLLDLQRRVLAGRGRELRGGQVEDALGLADRQRGLDVDVHEEILEHDDVGREALDEPPRLVVDLPQAHVGVVLGGGDDAAVAERPEAVALLLDDAPAGARRARVEAEDDHGLSPTLRMCPWPGPAAVVTS